MKNALTYTFLFVALQAGAGVAVKGLWTLLTGQTNLTALLLITTSAVSAVLTIALFLLVRWAEVSPRWLRSRQWAVLLWSVVAALGFAIPSAWLQELMPELPNVAEEQFNMILADRWGYVAIGLLAPLAEEVVFRGAVLRSLLKWADGRTPHAALLAVVVSALLFALVHFNPAQMPHAFVVGLLLGWMYWRTGSILPGMAYHWANNSLAYVLYNFYPDPDLKVADLFGGSQQHALMAVGFSLLILVPAVYQLHLWMRPADSHGQG